MKYLPLTPSGNRNILCIFLVFWSLGFQVACDDAEQGEVLSLQGGEDDVLQIDGQSAGQMMIANGSSEPAHEFLPQTVGLTIGADSVNLAEELLLMTAQAVEFAAIQSGGSQIVTSGTLTQTGNQFNFQPTPTDRLVLQYSNGTRFEIFVDQIQGNFESIDSFFDQDHSLSLRAVSEGVLNITVSSQKTDQQTQGNLQGDVLIDQVNYQLNLQRNKSINRNSVDFGSGERDTEEQLSGTIRAPNFEAQINEYSRYKLVIFDNAIENVTRTIDNLWVYAGTQYSLQQAMIRHETLNGWPNPSDYWVAEGSLLENGQVIGQILLDRQNLWIDVVLQMADGTRHNIQRHLLNSEDQ